MNKEKLKNDDLIKAKGGNGPHYDVTAYNCDLYSLDPESEDTNRSHKTCLYNANRTCPYYHSTIVYPEQRDGF